jgi:ATP-binding protein involved in chromosome partitioning
VSIDPRLLIIPERIRDVRRIIVVMSSKGGVGKTLISAILALIASKKGYSTGLLDLDFTNPSTHIVLGIDPKNIEFVEEKGVIPPQIHGVKYMSIALYAGDNPLPLRGNSVTDAFREILAITRWDGLDYLFIDTPPGIGDEHLELLTYLGDRLEILLVATPSPLAIRSVERLIVMLKDANYKINGLIENMSDKDTLREFALKHDIKYLGNIPFYKDIDTHIGNIGSLAKTLFWKRLEKIFQLI